MLAWISITVKVTVPLFYHSNVRRRSGAGARGWRQFCGLVRQVTSRLSPTPAEPRFRPVTGTCTGTRQLLQLRVLRFRREKDRNIRVRVFPKCEEILIALFGLGSVAFYRVRSA